MASLTITVSDVVVPRIQAAFGHWSTDTTPVWVSATVADLQAAIKTWIKGAVINYETTLAAQAKNASVSGEIW